MSEAVEIQKNSGGVATGSSGKIGARNDSPSSSSFNRGSESPSMNTLNRGTPVQQIPANLEPSDRLILTMKSRKKAKIEEALDNEEFKGCGANVGCFRVSPLHYACKNGIGYGIVKKLLDDGADANVADWRDQTPLHYAVKAGSSQKVWLLLQNNANASAPNKDGNTPLHFACAQNNMTVLRLLLENADDINATNQWDYTPLHFACENKMCKQDNKMLNMMLENGAELNNQNKFEKNPLQRSSELGHAVGTAFLIEHDGTKNFENVIEKAPWNGFKTFCAYRIKKKCLKILKQVLVNEIQGINASCKVDMILEVRPCVYKDEEW